MTEKEWYLENSAGIEIYLKEYIPAPDVAIKKTLIFIHGIGIYGDYYNEVVRGLVLQGVAVVTMDLQGHGHSGGEKGKFLSLTSVIEDIKMVVENIKNKNLDHKIYILGESMGGAFSYAYVKKYPDHIDGLILLAPSFLVKMGQLMYLNNLKLIFYLLYDRDKMVVDLQCGSRIEKSSTDEVFKKKRSTDPLSLMKVSANYLLTILKASCGWWKACINKKLPILLFHGKKDNIIPPLGTRIFYKSFGGADKKFIYYKDSFHTLLFDRNTAKLLDVVVDWLKDK